MDTLLSICLGIGLSAACGFRIFVPPLIMSIAAHSGHLHFSPGFAWMGSDAALIAFVVASTIEIAGYFIPWLDHLLDVLATPAAVVAGTIVSASTIAHLDPYLKWTLAAIAGGGIAGTIQGLTVFGRGASTATTGGLANPLFAMMELAGAVTTSFLAVFWPLLAMGLIALVLFLLAQKFIFAKRVRPQST